MLLTPRISLTNEAISKKYLADRYRRCGIEETFVQNNLSLSRRNVLRGLHGDPRMAELVFVVRGSVYDAIVDFDRKTPRIGTRLP